MPQRFRTAVANMAVYQLGAVAMPLSMLFGPDALATGCSTGGRWQPSSTRAPSPTCAPRGTQCPALRHVIAVGDAARPGRPRLGCRAGGRAGHLHRRETKADDAAVLIYTSGTTGPPRAR